MLDKGLDRLDPLSSGVMKKMEGGAASSQLPPFRVIRDKTDKIWRPSFISYMLWITNITFECTISWLTRIDPTEAVTVDKIMLPVHFSSSLLWWNVRVAHGHSWGWHSTPNPHVGSWFKLSHVKSSRSRVNKKQKRELIFPAVYFSWEFIICVCAGYKLVYFK